MKTQEFKEWLQVKYPDTITTVANRITNCNNVEKYYGDLDGHITKDKCNSILNALSYTADDERSKLPQKHLVPINGNIRNGSATLKQAVKLYADFCKTKN